MQEVRHWAEDRYWTEALDQFEALRQSGTVTLDIASIERGASAGDGPAYRLMEAMVSVWQQEAWEAHRGAPRVMLALLVRLAELSGSLPDSDPTED